MKASPKTTDEITAVLEKYSDLYLKAQLDDLMDLFSPEPDTTLINAGLEEKQVGRENIRSKIEQSLNQKETITLFQYHNLLISEKETVAWVSSDLEVKLEWEKNEMNLFLRLTAVFEKRDDNWLIVQMHSSAPLATSR